MSENRFQVTLKPASDLPADYVTNTLWYTILDPTPDYDNLCEDLATIFANFPHLGDVSVVQVKAYDMGDPEPRPVKGEHSMAYGAPGGAGPREVALCLSYYADRNLPRHRGRIYLGPLKLASMDSAQPAQTFLDDVLDLGDNLAGLGGADVSWQVNSTIEGMRNVTNTWVDNAWDTQRRRGLDATSRQGRGV